MKKWMMIALGFAIFAGFVGFIFQCRPRPSVTPGVTLENCRLLHLGMSPKEVEAILGKPDVTEGCMCCWANDDYYYNVVITYDEKFDVDFGHISFRNMSFFVKECPKSLVQRVYEFLGF